MAGVPQNAPNKHTPEWEARGGYLTLGKQYTELKHNLGR